MNRDEIYFFGFMTVVTVLVAVILYVLFRWTIRKNRIESIYEQKELLNSDDSSPNTK
jgi:ABC-type transport system involved in Fe-S cluster assembly fused permease/ATPase subunit